MLFPIRLLNLVWLDQLRVRTCDKSAERMKLEEEVAITAVYWWFDSVVAVPPFQHEFDSYLKQQAHSNLWKQPVQQSVKMFLSVE